MYFLIFLPALFIIGVTTLIFRRMNMSYILGDTSEYQALVHEQAKKLGITVACTVGELIDLLSKLPRELKVCSTGGDLGGYDVSTHEYVELTAHAGDDNVTLSHAEYEAWEKDNTLRALIDGRRCMLGETNET